MRSKGTVSRFSGVSCHDPCPKASKFNSSLCAPGAFRAAAYALSESLYRPIKRNAWIYSSFPSRTQLPLVITARCYGNSSFSHWSMGLGSQGVSSAAEIFLLIMNHHTVGVGPAHFAFLPLLLVVAWLFFISLVIGLCAASLQVVLHDGFSVIQF